MTEFNVRFRTRIVTSMGYSSRDLVFIKDYVLPFPPTKDMWYLFNEGTSDHEQEFSVNPSDIKYVTFIQHITEVEKTRKFLKSDKFEVYVEDKKDIVRYIRMSYDEKERWNEPNIIKMAEKMFNAGWRMNDENKAKLSFYKDGTWGNPAKKKRNEVF